MHLPSAIDVAAAGGLLAALPVATTLVVAGRRRPGPTRQSYRLLAAGVVLAALDVLAATRLLDLVGGGTRPPGALDPDSRLLAIGLVNSGAIATVLLLAGLIRLPALGVTRGELLRHLLDALVAAAGFCLIAWVLIADPTRVLGDATPPLCRLVLAASAATAVGVSLAIIVAHRSGGPSGPGSPSRSTAGSTGRRTGQIPGPRAGRVPRLLRPANLAAYSVAAICTAGTAMAAGARCGWPTVFSIAAGALPLAIAMLGRSVWVAGRPPASGTHLAGSRAAGLPARADRDNLPGATIVIVLTVLAVAALVYHLVSGGAMEPFGVGAGIVQGAALVVRQHLTLRDARAAAARLAEREARLWVLAYTDPLTGLPNRRGLLKELDEKVGDGLPGVLLGLDLDGFKNVNDMRGHDAGDAVLAEVGRRLRANLRPGDVAARLGGDEFAVLMQAGPAEARPVAERLLGVLSRPYEQPCGTVFLSASIGLAGCASAADVPSLLRNADLALRYAKQRGKSRVEEYDPGYESDLLRRTLIEHELRGAIDRGELHLAYQPVVALPSARTAGAEALLRWHHPELGKVPPFEFISVAEECGMIVRLGGFVLHQACHQLSLWLASGHDVWMSVNVSPYELHSPEYVPQVADALRTHRVPPQRLVLEVTEQVVAPDREEMIERLTALRQTGVRIALDDFGAGYNSLAQLRNLPLDILKIDHSLVAEVLPRPGSADAGQWCRRTKPLVDVVAEIGHRHGLEVIAEGVVGREQRDLVVKAGCRFAQGEMYGWPVPAEHLEALLSASEQVPASKRGQLSRHVGPVDSAREMRQA